MNDESIVSAASSGNFLALASEHDTSIRQDDEKRTEFIKQLISLHNSGRINLCREFLLLKNEQGVGADFFLALNLFEHALPELDAEVLDVVRCVNHLLAEAGNDGAAGSVVEGYKTYCRKDINRVKEAAELIVSGKQHLNLLESTLIVGSELDFAGFQQMTIELCSHDVVEIRNRSLWAIGRLSFQGNEYELKPSFDKWREVLSQKPPEEIVSSIIYSASLLAKDHELYQDDVADLLDLALAYEGELIELQAASLLSILGKNINNRIISLFFAAILKANASIDKILSNLDFGLSQVLESEDEERRDLGIGFFDEFIPKHPKHQWFERNMTSTRRVIINSEYGLRNKFASRWLMSGVHAKGEAASALLSAIGDKPILLSVDTSEVRVDDPKVVIYLARKSIGYLFNEPVCSASLLVSLASHLTDDKVVGDLIDLFFNTLLVNFPGSVRDFLLERKEQCDGLDKQVCIEALVLIDDYNKTIVDVGYLKDLEPPLLNRHIHAKRFSEQMNAAREKAESHSPLLSIFPRSTLLYGRKTIDYIQVSAGGERKRVENSLGSFETSTEIPRQSIIDPAGLDFMLRVFRAERMT